MLGASKWNRLSQALGIRDENGQVEGPDVLEGGLDVGQGVGVFANDPKRRTTHLGEGQKKKATQRGENT